MSVLSSFFLQHFDHPLYLFFFIPLFLILLYLSFRKYYHESDSQEVQLKKKKLGNIVLISRSVVVFLILLALANPFVEKQETIHGTPKLRFLVDNSTSMQVMNQSLAPYLASELEKRMPIEVSSLAEGDHSALGDNILASLRKDENLLLFTDGYVTDGLSLGDVGLYATQFNTTISAFSLKQSKYDTAVHVLGPEKTTPSAENTFLINLQQSEQKQIPVTITLDGETIFDEVTTVPSVTFKRSFTEGTHYLKATVGLNDYFTQNNIFYKTVKVVPKPKVFFLTAYAGSPLAQALSPQYDFEQGNSLPKDLSPYTAVIVNNFEASALQPRLDDLVNFVAGGNGLVVIGGTQAYESGGYKGSRLEQFLPVSIAQAGKKQGDISIVLVIDISGSTGGYVGGDTKLDIQKALAIGILKDISLVNRVGAVAFNTEAYTLANVSLLIEQPDLEDKIARLVFNGGTYIDTGIGQAVNLLQNAHGSKNIILISDGLTRDLDKAVSVANYAASQGIRIYTVGVGEDTNTEVMQQIADISGGAFFQPDTKERLKLLFGSTEISGTRRVIPLTIFDDQHFITQGINLKANVYGFNTFFPKPGAKVLVTTDTGDPLVVAWRFGLGRIVSVGTDDGTLYAPDLLNKQNSGLWTRITNWGIGDPERKNIHYIDIHDTRVGQATDVLFKSPDEPRSDLFPFVKIDQDLYKATFTPNATGFQQVLDTGYGVNGPLEYASTGMNPELKTFVESTGGKLFSPADLDAVVAFMKVKSKRTILQKHSYAWIFALLALILFLSEIAVRRIFRNFYKS